MEITQKSDPVSIVQAAAHKLLCISASLPPKPYHLKNIPTEALCISTTLPSGPCHLENIPIEILFDIAKNLGPRNLSFLIRTSLYFESILTPELHQLALVQKDVSIHLPRFFRPRDIPILCWAAAIGNYPLACFLVNNGVDINARDGVQDGTPLHYAARAFEPSDSNMKIMDLLLKNGADTKATDGEGNTPLHFASVHNIPTLLREGVNIEALNGMGRTRLHAAARRANSYQTVELLLNNGANVGARNPHNRYTPLHEAIESELDGQPSLEIITLLLDRGANIEASAEGGCTPFVLAIRRQPEDAIFVSLITLLLDRGANINVSDEHGMTPLLVAASEPRKKDLIPLLLERGANIEARDKERETVLHLGLAHGELDLGLLNLLLDRGANIEAQNKAGNTALHIAMKKKGAEVEVIRLLLARGAWKGINAPPYMNGYETVLNMAMRYGLSSSVKDLLKENVAKLSR